MAATLKPISGKIQCDGSILYGPDNLNPEWDKIPTEYNFVAIDADGEEFMFRDEPTMLTCVWSGLSIETGRMFDMSVIDWKETLSQRPT